jgi:hypothetical protein
MFFPCIFYVHVAVAYPGFFFWGGGTYARIFFRGFQQIHLRTEGRKNRDQGALVPKSGVPLNSKMSETSILVWLLRMYFPRNWEFASDLSNIRNLGGFNSPTPPPPVRHCHVGMLVLKKGNVTGDSLIALLYWNMAPSTPLKVTLHPCYLEQLPCFRPIRRTGL